MNENEKIIDTLTQFLDHDIDQDTMLEELFRYARTTPGSTKPKKGAKP